MRTGITFVYVTHDQAEALALSDHVAVISGGRLQQFGTPFDIYAHPANRMVADFMGQVNLLPGRVRSAEDRRFVVELAPGLALEIAAAADFAPGDSVEVAVRPESIRLESPRPAPAGAPGKIAAHVFLGNVREYDVALACGPVLRVQTHPLQRFEVGAAVTIAIDVAQCGVFSR